MRRVVAAAICTLFLLSCGGGSSGPTRPKPLRTKLDDMYLASLPMNQREPVINAQTEYSRAKMAYANARSSHNEARTNKSVAENELKQAKLDADSALTKKKAADETADMTRVSAANKRLRTADLKVNMAKSKIKAWKAYSKAREYKELYAEENMFLMEAKYELAKAQLAKSNNVKPKGFNYGKFQEQERDRSRRAQKAKVFAEKEHSKAKATWKKYEGKKRSYEKATNSK